VTPLFLFVYLLLALVLFVNLLIAMFNARYTEVRAEADYLVRERNVYTLRAYIVQYPLPAPVNIPALIVDALYTGIQKCVRFTGRYWYRLQGRLPPQLQCLRLTAEPKPFVRISTKREHYPSFRPIREEDVEELLKQARKRYAQKCSFERWQNEESQRRRLESLDGKMSELKDQLSEMKEHFEHKLKQELSDHFDAKLKAAVAEITQKLQPGSPRQPPGMQSRESSVAAPSAEMTRVEERLQSEARIADGTPPHALEMQSKVPAAIASELAAPAEAAPAEAAPTEAAPAEAAPAEAAPAEAAPAEAAPAEAAPAEAAPAEAAPAEEDAGTPSRSAAATAWRQKAWHGRQAIRL